MFDRVFPCSNCRSGGLPTSIAALRPAHVRHWVEALVDIEHVLRGGVEFFLGSSAVVNTVFHATGDANLHFLSDVGLTCARGTF